MMTNELWGVLYSLGWTLAIGMKLGLWDWPRRPRIGDPTKVLFRIRSGFFVFRALSALLGVALVVEGGWLLAVFLAGRSEALFGVIVLMIPFLAFVQSGIAVQERDVVTTSAVFLSGSRYGLDDFSTAESRGPRRIRLVWRTPRWGMEGFSIRPFGLDRDSALEILLSHLRAPGPDRQADDLP